MPTSRHLAADPRESFKVKSLPGQQRERLEVWNHSPEEILEAPCFPLQRPVAAVWSDASASEVRLHQVEDLSAISVLTDGKAWPHLPAHEQRRPWGNGNGEAAFAVDVSGDVRREELATVPGAGV
jgi:hypothetical protein